MNKKLSINTMLQKIAEPKLNKLGFKFDGKIDTVLWRFSRQSGELQQFVIFQKSNLIPQALRVELSTSLKPMDIVYGNQLIQRQEDWWQYTDEISLGNVIEELTEIVVELGIEMLDILGTPDLTPAEEIGKVLLHNPEARARDIEEKYNLSLSDLTSLKQLENLLLKRKAEFSVVDWDFILNSSAFLGEIVRHHLGGVWGWEEMRKTPSINEIGKRKVLTFAPLLVTSLFWGNPKREFYGIEVSFNITKFLASK